MRSISSYTHSNIVLLIIISICSFITQSHGEKREWQVVLWQWWYHGWIPSFDKKTSPFRSRHQTQKLICFINDYLTRHTLQNLVFHVDRIFLFCIVLFFRISQLLQPFCTNTHVSSTTAKWLNVFHRCFRRTAFSELLQRGILLFIIFSDEATATHDFM